MGENLEITSKNYLSLLAITRAKNELYLMYPETINKFGMEETAGLSRYVGDKKRIKNYLKTLKVK